MRAEPFDELRTAPFDKLRTAPVEARSAPFDKLRAQAAAGDHLLLLDCDGLGQVARLIDIMAFLGGKFAGEHLQRHGRHQGLQ
jgi:hypothetical protein